MRPQESKQSLTFSSQSLTASSVLCHFQYPYVAYPNAFCVMSLNASRVVSSCHTFSPHRTYQYPILVRVPSRTLKSAQFPKSGPYDMLPGGRANLHPLTTSMRRVPILHTQNVLTSRDQQQCNDPPFQCQVILSCALTFSSCGID